MKKLFVTLFMAACTALYAGDFTPYRIQDYDYKTNRFYYGVLSTSDDDLTVNICVYDSVQNKSVYIFPADNKEVIRGFIFQVGYSVNSGRMILNTAYNDSQFCDDNNRIDYKKASGNLLIITRSKSDDMNHLYICSKTGENLKELKRFDDETDYEIDTINNKLILRKQSGQLLVIESFSY